MSITRRDVNAALFAAAASAVLKPSRAAAAINFGPPVKFDEAALREWAEFAARQPYAPAPLRAPEIIARIDYDNYQQIKYRPDAAVWADGSAPFPVELFHVGKYFQQPARIFVLDGSLAREVLYSPDLFNYGRAEFSRTLPPDLGFAGFRVMYGAGQPDWLAFLGASYFRSSGETRQYGLSARGLAIDTAMPWPEEFPRFTNFWLAPHRNPDGVVIHAMLDSPSVTGAYKITATRGQGVITDVEATIFARKDVARLGIAPLTSMYWYGKTNRRQATDWRPEIHDSDGLALWTGTGERIWRPLNNPFGVQTSTYLDNNPRGFGLAQRERDFDEYEDDGVFYDKRPTVWIEPIGAWGEGGVQLVEIPTIDETNDNIVAYWLPKEPLKAGGSISLKYRVHWRLEEPYPAPLGRVVATRAGAGGIPGHPQREGVTKYVVDFEGGDMGRLENTDGVQLDVTAARGAIDKKFAYRVVGKPRWRAMFDLTPTDREPIDLRLYLHRNGEALTETWLYQHLSR
ncbi:MAG: glucan biosynthesis protein D [Hyphomicrobiales bacterium]|nr:glucan biosynthesis protein D [Hyphomicrobiales bacterium]